MTLSPGVERGNCLKILRHRIAPKNLLKWNFGRGTCASSFVGVASSVLEIS